MESPTSQGKPTSPFPGPQEKRYPYDLDDGRVGYDDDLVVPSLEHTTEHKLLAKIDLRVMPVLVVMFFLAFLDKVNIAFNATLGMLDDLHMGGTDYNTALVIFFVPYCLFEIPGNLLLKKFKPHVWLSFCMFGFGVVGMCQGFVTNYSGLLATRFFLGVMETSVFPGSFYLLSMWYRRFEAQKRFSFFFGSASLSGAFGGLLAAAIYNMDGIAGYAGWRWIFILEGLLTIAVAILFFFTIPDFPEDAKFLSDEERNYIQARLRADQGKSAVESRITLKEIGQVFKDPKVPIMGITYFSMIVPAYGYAYFSPTIIKGYNNDKIQTQLLSVPPWACAFVFGMILAYWSDKLKNRFAFAMLGIVTALTGFAILLGVHDQLDVQYAALYLCVMGVYGAMPVIICWFNMNMGGHHRRAVATAWQIGFGNLGGIPAVYAFLKEDAPLYTLGYGLMLGFLCFALLGSTTYLAVCISQNRKKAKMPRRVDSKEELGDLHPDYKYLY